MLSRLSHCRYRGLPELASALATPRASPKHIQPRCTQQASPHVRRQSTLSHYGQPQGKLKTSFGKSKAHEPIRLSTPHPDPQLVDGEALKVSEDKAIEEAFQGRAHSLHACLASRLKKQDYSEVISLFQRYAGLLGDQEIKEASKKEEAAGATEKQDTSLSRVLLCAVTAHAAEGSFRPLLEAYLKLGAPEIPVAIRREHLDSIEDGDIHNKTLAYAQDLAVAHFIANPVNLSKYLVSLSHSSMSRAMTTLYEGVLDKITGPSAFIAVSEAQRHDRPLLMSDVSWASFITGFLRCQKVDLAQRVLEDIKALKVSPGTATWTAHIGIFNQLRLVAPALETWDQMLAAGVEPDAVTYLTILSLLFREGDARHALQTFAQFQLKESAMEPSQVLQVYNAVIDGLLRNKLVPQAEQFLQLMEARGVSPDIVTFNTFLKYHSRGQDFKNILKTMGLMEERKIKADVYSFSTILSALLRAGRKDAVAVVIECMKEQNVQANVAIYSALIDDQLRKGEEANWRAALALLTSMEGNEKLSPNNVTYTTILAHLHRKNGLSRKTQEQHRHEVLRRMRERQVWFSLPDYHILMKACFDYPNETNTQMALRYYREIKRRGISCVNSTYYILLAGLIHNEEWALARDIVEEINLPKISPSLSKLIQVVLAHTA